MAAVRCTPRLPAPGAARRRRAGGGPPWSTGAPQRPARWPRQPTASQRPAPARPRGAPCTSLRVQPLTVLGLEPSGPARTAPPCLHARCRASAHAPCGRDLPPPLVALADCGAHDRGPRTTPWPSALPGIPGLTKGRPESPASDTTPSVPIPSGRRAAPPLTRAIRRQLRGLVARGAHRARTPQARLAQQRQRHPPEATRGLAAARLGLDVPECTGRRDPSSVTAWP